MSLAPPDIEQLLVAHLKRRLAPLHVGTKVPNPTPDAFIRVSSTGGTSRDIARLTMTVLFESWGARQGAASDNAARLWAEVVALDGEWLSEDVWVSRAHAAVPTNFPDRTTSLARYQFMASLLVNLIPLEERQ